MRTISTIIQLVVTLLFFVSCSDNTPTRKLGSHNHVATVDNNLLMEWKTGATVTATQVSHFGIDKCFVVTTITDSVWKSLGEKSTTSRDDLRHIKMLHWGLDKKIHLGEMIANRIIADTLAMIFRQLYDSHYPIERIELASNYNNDDEAQMRDNNTSCYCPRTVRSTNVMSKHASGMAVDINPLYNPYFKKRRNGTCDVLPSTAMPYCDRNKTFPCKIDHNDLAFVIFTLHGFKWGGDWKSCKDYQHFEY